MYQLWINFGDYIYPNWKMTGFYETEQRALEHVDDEDNCSGQNSYTVVRVDVFRQG